MTTPDVHETHAVAERDAQDIQDGMRVPWVRAVWPAVARQHAATCYVLRCNNIDMTPHQVDCPGMAIVYARTGAPFKGQAIPLGGSVWFIPAQPRHLTGITAPQTRDGICMGGIVYKHEHIVVDLDMCVGTHLGVDANATWGTVYRHNTNKGRPLFNHMCFAKTA